MGNEQREQGQGPAGETIGPKWGDPLDRLDEGRKAELAERLWAWTPEQANEERPGPFAGERLNGLEVHWLAACALEGREGDTAWAAQRLVDDEDRYSIGLRGLHLERAFLVGAHLEGAFLGGARLEGADLTEAHLERALLVVAHLEGADLKLARLEGATLWQAHLEGADLGGARLEGADLTEAHLERADLGGASLDKATRLNEATLTGISLDQATLDGTNLTVVEWDRVPVLGDELLAETARAAKPKDAQVPGDSQPRGAPKPRQQRADEYAAAARVYRLLTVALQSGGMGDVAARYAYRAQIMQRKRRWHQRRLGAWLGSAFLALFAGYGYRLGRVFAAYGLTVALFAVLYLLTGLGLGGGAHLSWRAIADAAQISLNAIHGRVFFAQFGLDTVQSWIATAESICGIVIEAIFTAVLIQRLFSR